MPSNESFSGAKRYSNKKYLSSSAQNSDIFRADNLTDYPAAKAYNEMIENEDLKQINHLFYDLSDKDVFELIVLTDNHWGSIASHFKASINAQLIAKYIPNVYLGYNGDNRNNAINTAQCVSSSLDNALPPTVELKLWYEMFQDKIIQEKTLFINSGNHDNGKRTQDVGADILATFYAGTPYFSRYSRFATLLTIRLKADTKKGYEDVKIYVDHGNSIKGSDGAKLEKGKKLAESLGARVAIFGHVHQDMIADYRIKKVSDLEKGKGVYDDLTVILLPATMGPEIYSLDERYETAPSDLKLIRIGSIKNNYLTGSTQLERRSLDKTSFFVDCMPIPTEYWKNATKEASRLKKVYVDLQTEKNPNNSSKIENLVEEYFNNSSTLEQN